MPEPGVLARTASIMAEMNIRILSLSFTSRGDKRHITAFIDLTDSKHTLEELVEKLKKQEFVIRVKYSGADLPGLLVDKHCFPIETLGRRIRALLIPVKTLSNIFADLKKRYGKVSWVLAYHQGVVLGELITKHLVKYFPESQMELAQALTKLYSAYGWGRMRIEPFDIAAKEFKVIIEDNFEVEGYERSDEPVCHFTRGILCGAVSVMWRDEYEFEVREISCKAQGKAFCEFIVRRKYESSSTNPD